jgi:hypothetical protein
MRKYSQAFRLLLNGRAPVPGLDCAATYVTTGDPAQLARLRPAPGGQIYWGMELLDELPPPGRLDGEDARVLHVLFRGDCLAPTGWWLSECLRAEPEGAEWFGAVAGHLADAGAARRDLFELVGGVRCLEGHGRPNSAGRFVLSLDEGELVAACRSALAAGTICQGVLLFLLRHAPERIGEAHRDLALGAEPLVAAAHADLLLRRDGARHADAIYQFFRQLEEPAARFDLAAALARFDPARFGDEMLACCHALLAVPWPQGVQIAAPEIVLEVFGADAVPLLAMSVRDGLRWQIAKDFGSIVRRIGPAAMPLIDAMLDTGDADMRLPALEVLMALHPPGSHERIETEVRDLLNARNVEAVLRTIDCAVAWNRERMSGALWRLLAHRSKQVRDKAAEVLAQDGDAAVARAAEHLDRKRATVRLAAVALLARIDSDAAHAALATHRDAEEDADVRDEILRALPRAVAGTSTEVPMSEIHRLVERAAAKLTSPPAKWVNVAALPPLTTTGGDRLDERTVTYLLYRQSRSKEMEPDVEAKALYALIDRGTSGEFALAIWAAFLASGAAAKDRWAMAVAALLGDDRLVPSMVRQIQEWPKRSRGKLAEYAAQALALIGTDPALMAVDSLATRFRSKWKNIGRAAAEAFRSAAEAQGVSVEELGDRVVPWLGFEPGRPRVIEAGGRRLEVRVSSAFKFVYHDLDRKKRIQSLPKAVPDDIRAELKTAGKLLRDVVKAQKLRLESMLVRQHRWPAPRWRELFLEHPILRPFGTQLVWGAGAPDGAPGTVFRALEDGSLTDVHDDEVSLADDAMIGMVHPLELDGGERAAWMQHLADYEIEPPFPQLSRPVVTVEPQDRSRRTFDTLDGRTINAMTFRGRAERLGWVRGSVCDAGGVMCYHRQFPASGADFILMLNDMYIGIDLYSDITLGRGHFVRSGSVAIGSYVYDEPENERDARVIPFGAVPPIVFSEVMGELRRIAGGSGGPG